MPRPPQRPWLDGARTGYGRCRGVAASRRGGVTSLHAASLSLLRYQRQRRHGRGLLVRWGERRLRVHCPGDVVATREVMLAVVVSVPQPKSALSSRQPIYTRGNPCGAKQSEELEIFGKGIEISTKNNNNNTTTAMNNAWVCQTKALSFCSRK